MATLEIEGLVELAKKLKDNVQMDDVKRVVRYNGSQLQRKMMRNADFKKGYQTGTTKRSIGYEFKDGGFAVTIGPETEYSPYLEYGTRFMESQPFVKPAFDDQKGKFKSDLQKLMR